MTWDEPQILQRLQQVIQAQKSSGPVSEAEIADAEEALAVRFPTSYRLFLKYFGAAWMPGYEVAGIAPGRSTDAEPPLWLHVVDATSQARRAARGFSRSGRRDRGTLRM